MHICLQKHCTPHQKLVRSYLPRLENNLKSINRKEFLSLQIHCKTLSVSVEDTLCFNIWMSLRLRLDLVSWFNSGSQPIIAGAYHPLLECLLSRYDQLRFEIMQPTLYNSFFLIQSMQIVMHLYQFLTNLQCIFTSLVQRHTTNKQKKGQDRILRLERSYLRWMFDNDSRWFIKC